LHYVTGKETTSLELEDFKHLIDSHGALK